MEAYFSGSDNTFWPSELPFASFPQTCLQNLPSFSNKQTSSLSLFLFWSAFRMTVHPLPMISAIWGPEMNCSSTPGYLCSQEAGVAHRPISLLTLSPSSLTFFFSCSKKYKLLPSSRTLSIKNFQTSLSTFSPSSFPFATMFSILSQQKESTSSRRSSTCWGVSISCSSFSVGVSW